MKIINVLNKIKNYDYNEIKNKLENVLLKEDIKPFNKRDHAIIIITTINTLISHYSMQSSSKLKRRIKNDNKYKN